MTGRRALGVLLAGLAGLIASIQARINGELGARLDDGVAAAVISFGLGLLLLGLVLPWLPVARRGLRSVHTALRSGGLRWWHCLGGVCGGFVVASQGLTVAVLGVAAFTVALVAGQTASSLLVDRAGIGPGAAEPVSRRRLVGAGLAVAAVLLAVADRLDTPRTLGLAAIPLLAGVGIAWQQAVNGRVRATAGSAWPATLVNFFAGTAALLLWFGGLLAFRGAPPGELPSEPWLYVGGLLGIVVIAIAATVVRVTGVLLLGMAAVAGQMVGALLLDLLAPTDGPPRLNTYAGAAVTLVAVVVAVGLRRPAPVPR